MPGAGTSLPNLRWQKSSCGCQPQGTCDIPCRAEKGSSSSSQAGDKSGSPRIPLLLLTGWGRWLHHHYGLPPSTGRAQVLCKLQASRLPASLMTGVQHWSCQVSKVNFSGSSGRLILGMLITTGLSAAFLKTTLAQMFRPDLQTRQPGVPESGQYQNQSFFSFPWYYSILTTSQDGPTLQNTALRKNSWCSRSQFRCQQ